MQRSGVSTNYWTSPPPPPSPPPGRIWSPPIYPTSATSAGDALAPPSPQTQRVSSTGGIGGFAGGLGIMSYFIIFAIPGTASHSPCPCFYSSASSIFS